MNMPFENDTYGKHMHQAWRMTSHTIVSWPSLLIILLCLCITNRSFAHKALKKLPQSAIQHIVYQKNQIIKLEGTPLIATQIIFGEQEHIIDVISGDTLAWQVHINQQLQNVLNVKPNQADSQSNLHVVTIDSHQLKRYYHFLLFSHHRDLTTHTACQVLRFNAVRTDSTLIHTSDNLQPIIANHHYSFHGAQALKPIQAFDDKRFTYFKWNPNQTLPAVFAVYDAAGHEQLVNYRRINDYLVVMQIAPQFTLRYGATQVASIFNDERIKELVANNLD